MVTGARMPDNNNDVETQHVHTYTTPGTYYPQATCGGYTATAGPVEVEGDQLETPENLTVSDVTDTTAAVSWDSVEDAETYLVTVQPGDAPPQETSSTSVGLEELLPETSYTVSVVAQAEGIGDSDPASESFETSSSETTQLDTPTGVEASGASESSIDISWSSVTDAGEYLVQYRVTGADDWSSAPVVTDTSATVTGLEAETEYELRVTARAEGFDDSEPSSVVTATTEDETPPQLDTPEVTTGDVGSDSVALSWSAIDNAENYLVEYRVADSSDWSEIDAVTSPEATVTGLEPSTEYELRVTARAEGYTDSDPSSVVTATTTSDDELAAPGGLDSPAQTTTAIDVEWSSVEGAEEYELRYRISGDEDWTSGESVSTTAATLDDLQADTSYEVQVRAVDGDDVSDWSDTLEQSTEE